MNNILQESFILGLPIETTIGECKFLRVKDYYKYGAALQMVSYNNVALAYELSKLYKFDTDTTENLKHSNLYDIVMNLSPVFALYQFLYSFIFDQEDIMKKINEENFDDIRNLVLAMNAMSEEKASPNPEIQKWLDKSKKMNSGNSLTLSDIAVIVSGYKKCSYKEIIDYTLIQLYSDFYQCGSFINYFTSSLFATVAPKIEITPWANKIDINKKDTHSLKRSEYENLRKNIGI